MNMILHNSVTELPLIYFLMLYAAGSLIGLIAGSLWIWLCDGTRDEDLREDSLGLLDPYEIAFLSGDAKRVARLVVFDLLERGHVELRTSRPWRALFASTELLQRSDSPPMLAELTPIQRAAWNWMSRPRAPREVLHRHLGLVNVIRPLCQVLVRPLTERRLLETGHRRSMCRVVRWTLTDGLVGMGLYKLITAAIAGHDETFGLILMMVVGWLFTAAICRPQRLSDLGQRTLDRLEMEYGDGNHAWLMSERTAESKSSRFAEAAGFAGNADRLVAMALFGTVGVRCESGQLHENDNTPFTRVQAGCCGSVAKRA